MMYALGCQYCGCGVIDHTACPYRQTTNFISANTFTVTVEPQARPKNKPYYQQFNKQRVPKVIKK